ncbi:hypothetical protein QYR00_24095 (plasmid) [Agrobacterium tumefaciens]|nr:hypothetical protein [Rhizobium rosettiformans]MDR7031024.1 hypothetical protein [Rhizobium rosettiformans]MDR7066927.1 hypothetical protein [Rhizobium rosettiformans]WKL23606.1 hypothetical protein QYR00_24095 [Agrobacterium tumefaciens]
MSGHGDAGLGRANGVPLNALDVSTIYGGAAKSFTDYLTYRT